MTTYSNAFCPLCEVETDVPLTDVQSPTIPPFMPDDYVLVGILRSRGHVCRRDDVQARALVDLIEALDGSFDPMNDPSAISEEA